VSYQEALERARKAICLLYNLIINREMFVDEAVRKQNVDD
jgi:hypothetical protein